MKTIPLTNRRGDLLALAMVSDVDYAAAIIHKWHLAVIKKGMAREKRYAVAWIGGKRTLMHRFILNPAQGLHVDHRDNSGLNNTRENIRPCTRQENARNRPGSINSKLGHKHIRRSGSGYRVTIWQGSAHLRQNRPLYDRTFRDLDAAISVRDRQLRVLHGEFLYEEKTPPIVAN